MFLFSIYICGNIYREYFIGLFHEYKITFSEDLFLKKSSTIKYFFEISNYIFNEVVFRFEYLF